MSDDKYLDRKKKVDTFLLKSEIEITVKFLKPFHKEEILKEFDLSDDFIFSINDSLDNEINYFLNKKIDYSLETEAIVILLEKAAYLDVFLSITIELVKTLCKKIKFDLKHSELQNIE